MKETRKIVLFALMLGVLGACGSSRYIISTNNGTLIQADGEPRLNSKTGMYEYRDLDGNSAKIQKDDVRQVMER